MSLVVDRGQRVDRPRGQRTDPHPRPARRQHPDSAPPGREAPHRVVGWAHRNAPLCPVAAGKDTQQISSSRHHERRVPAAATGHAPLPTVPPSSLQREGLCPRLHPSHPPWGGQCGPRCTWGTLCPVLDRPAALRVTCLSHPPKGQRGVSHCSAPFLGPNGAGRALRPWPAVTGRLGRGRGEGEGSSPGGTAPRSHPGESEKKANPRPSGGCRPRPLSPEPGPSSGGLARGPCQVPPHPGLVFLVARLAQAVTGRGGGRPQGRHIPGCHRGPEAGRHLQALFQVVAPHPEAVAQKVGSPSTPDPALRAAPLFEKLRATMCLAF